MIALTRSVVQSCLLAALHVCVEAEEITVWHKNSQLLNQQVVMPSTRTLSLSLCFCLEKFYENESKAYDSPAAHHPAHGHPHQDMPSAFPPVLYYHHHHHHPLFTTATVTTTSSPSSPPPLHHHHHHCHYPLSLSVTIITVTTPSPLASPPSLSPPRHPQRHQHHRHRGTMSRPLVHITRLDILPVVRGVPSLPQLHVWPAREVLMFILMWFLSLCRLLLLTSCSPGSPSCSSSTLFFFFFHPLHFLPSSSFSYSFPSASSSSSFPSFLILFYLPLLFFLYLPLLFFFLFFFFSPLHVIVQFFG